MHNQSTLNLRRLGITLLLGFSSGLPLSLSGSTLQAWFTTAGISLVAIGALSLIGQPYIYKFLWAPLLDRFTIPRLGRRRGWMIIFQIGLIITLIAMAFGNPITHPYWLAGFAIVVAFCSASQDTAIDAYRTDLLTPQERGLGAALYIGGYRAALVVAGGVALILADHIGWRLTYLIMASSMSIGLLASWFGPQPPSSDAQSPKSLTSAIYQPFREFLTRPYAWILLLFIIFYKLGDALSLSLITPFLIRGLHFSLTVVGAVNKGVGLLGTLLGILLGGLIMTRVSLYRALFIFGVLQIVAIMTLWLLAVVGKNYLVLVAVVFSDTLFNGMGTTALVAFLMSLCDHRYTATQFALLSAFSAVPRVFLGPLAGVMVEHIGWPSFFVWSIIASLPGLALLWYLRPTTVEKLETGQTIS